MGAVDQILVAALSSAGVKNVAKTKMIVYGSVMALATIGVVVVAVKIRKASQRKAQLRDEKNYDSVDRSNEMDQVNVSTRNLTISEGEAILISQNLLGAMDRWGTDEKAIIASLSQCNTKDDLLLVTKKFGTKPYSGTGLAENWLTRTGYKNLVGWLRAELNSRETAKVKAIYDRLGVPF